MLVDGNQSRHEKENPGLLLMLLFLGTFDVHRRDWRALLRRMRLLRLGHKRQKTLVLRMKWQKTIELRKKAQYNPPSPPLYNSHHNFIVIYSAIISVEWNFLAVLWNFVSDGG